MKINYDDGDSLTCLDFIGYKVYFSDNNKSRLEK